MKEKHYAYPVNWTNIGDVNPERHGGIFIIWDNDMWHIITTRHYADLPDGLTENEHMFEHTWVEPQDFWKNGNPENGFTEWAKSQLETFSNLGFSLVHSESELPEGETYADYMRLVLDESGKKLIHTLLFAYEGYYGGQSTDFVEDYWDYLEKQGIEKEKFKE